MSRIPGVFKGGGGIVRDIMYRFADTKGGLKGEGLLLKVYCIVSRIPRMF